jgi:hypothetical protein
MWVSALMGSLWFPPPLFVFSFFRSYMHHGVQTRSHSYPRPLLWFSPYTFESIFWYFIMAAAAGGMGLGWRGRDASCGKPVGWERFGNEKRVCLVGLGNIDLGFLLLYACLTYSLGSTRYSVHGVMMGLWMVGVGVWPRRYPSRGGGSDCYLVRDVWMMVMPN